MSAFKVRSFNSIYNLNNDEITSLSHYIHIVDAKMVWNISGYLKENRFLSVLILTFYLANDAWRAVLVSQDGCQFPWVSGSRVYRLHGTAWGDKTKSDHLGQNIQLCSSSVTSHPWNVLNVTSKPTPLYMWYCHNIVTMLYTDIV